MQERQTRFRPLQQARRWLWLVAALFLLLTLVGAVIAATARDQQLQRVVNQAQIGTFALSIMTAIVAVTAHLHQRVREISTPSDAAAFLVKAVLRTEQQSRLALLGDAVAANLSFDLDDSTRPAEEVRHGWLGALFGLVRFEDERGSPYGDLATIERFFADLYPRRLVILGEPGSGKTVMAIQLIVQLLERRFHRSDVEPYAIPVRIGLAGWDTNRSLEDWIAERLEMDYGLPRSLGRKLVEERRVLPVLDGLDEMDSDTASNASVRRPQRAVAALEELNSYLHGTQRASVVVTCRTERYRELEQLGTILRDARKIRIRPLASDQISTYIQTMFRDEPRQLAAWKEAINQLQARSGFALRAALSTPWRLHLAIVLSQAGMAPSELLAISGRQEMDALHRIDQMLLAGYVGARIELADSARGIARYDPSDVTSWLHGLALHLDWQAAKAESMEDRPPGLSGTDLVPHLLWPLGGWRSVRVLHAVLAILVAVIGLSATIVGTREVQLTIKVPSSVLAFSGATTWATSLAMLYFLVRLSVEAWPTVRFAARTRIAMRRRIILGLRVGVRTILWMGAGGGMALGIRLGFESASEGTIVSGIVGGVIGAIGGAIGASVLAVLTFGWVFAFPVALVAGYESWSYNADVSTPQAPLRSDLLVGSTVAISFALAFSLFELAIGGTFIGFVGSITLGMAMMIALGGRAWVRYRIGLVLAALHGRFPWRPGRFMDWACAAGLLRASGTAYQFRHLELQHWLVQHGNSRVSADAPHGIIL